MGKITFLLLSLIMAISCSEERRECEHIIPDNIKIGILYNSEIQYFDAKNYGFSKPDSFNIHNWAEFTEKDFAKFHSYIVNPTIDINKICSYCFYTDNLIGDSSILYLQDIQGISIYYIEDNNIYHQLIKMGNGGFEKVGKHSKQVDDIIAQFTNNIIRNEITNCKKGNCSDFIIFSEAKDEQYFKIIEGIVPKEIIEKFRREKNENKN